jgi:hypothetical protein
LNFKLIEIQKFNFTTQSSHSLIETATGDYSFLQTYKKRMVKLLRFSKYTTNPRQKPTKAPPFTNATQNQTKKSEKFLRFSHSVAKDSKESSPAFIQPATPLQ